MGPHSRSPYPAHVTVYPYNEYIRGTNPVVRHVISLTGTLKRMRANQRVPKHAATQPLHGSTPCARAQSHNNSIGAQSRRPGACYRYPYNSHIRGINPIVRHVMSLTWTPKTGACKSTCPKTSQKTTFFHKSRTHPGRDSSMHYAQQF